MMKLMMMMTMASMMKLVVMMMMMMVVMKVMSLGILLKNITLNVSDVSHVTYTHR